MSNMMDDGFLYLKGRGAEAKGKYVDGGFIVLAGAIIAQDETKKCAESVHKERAGYFADGTFADGKLTRDLLFKGIARACSVLTGGIGDGRGYWRYINGESITERELRESREKQEQVQSSPPAGPYTTGCPALENAIRISAMNKEYMGITPVINALIRAMKNDLEVLIPMESVKGDGDSQDFSLRTLSMKDGSVWLPVFTNKTEIDKGSKTSMAPQLMTDMIKLVSENEELAGIVINPFGDCTFHLPRDPIADLLKEEPCNHISVIPAECIEMPVDMIVNPAGASRAAQEQMIRERCGGAVMREYALLHKIEPGAAGATDAGDLPAGKIVHFTAPDYSSS